MNSMLGFLAFGGAGLVLIWVVSGQRQTPEGVLETNENARSLETSGLQRLVLPALTSDRAPDRQRCLPPGRLRGHAPADHPRRTPEHLERREGHDVEGPRAPSPVSPGALFILSWQQNDHVPWSSPCWSAGIGLLRQSTSRSTRRPAPVSSRSNRPSPTSSIRSAVCVEAGLGFDAALAPVFPEQRQPPRR